METTKGHTPHGYWVRILGIYKPDVIPNERGSEFMVMNKPKPGILVTKIIDEYKHPKAANTICIVILTENDEQKLFYVHELIMHTIKRKIEDSSCYIVKINTPDGNVTTTLRYY